jgi:hypothetical protein
MKKKNHFLYSGIGSRKISNESATIIHSIAKSLSKIDHTLRSGGAEGSDMAFELSAIKKQIYLPWKNYNNNNSSLYTPTEDAIELSSKFHPNWKNLSDSVKKLMGRNAHIILGDDLMSAVDFVVYCAPLDDFGNVMGGTGQAIRIANHYNIPTYNILIEKELNQLRELYKTLECDYIMGIITFMSLFRSEEFSNKQIAIMDMYVDMHRNGKLISFSDEYAQIKHYFINLLKHVKI